MREKIPCELIRDLMPLYLDELTSEKTEEVIREHLQECDGCREYCCRMKMDLERKSETRQEENKREIDYLKKVRKSSWKRMALGAVFVLAAVCSAIFVKLFLVGFPSDAYAVTYLEPNPQQRQVRVGGSFYASAVVYSRYKIKKEPDGADKLILYTCLPSAWNRNGVFNIEVDMSGVEEGLDVNGATVKPDGTVIDRMSNALFQAVNPYIGAMPANGKIAELLGISRELGPFQNELQTSEEPYAWYLHFEDNVSATAGFEDKMRRYACVLMAAIDNLGEVGWDYPAAPGSEAERIEGFMTEDECSEYVGSNIKAFSESPEKMQELLEKLEIIE